MGESRTDAHSIGGGGDRLTIAQAAALLGVHKNTVRNRIKNGAYRAEMVQTERGPTYLIERESLLTNLTTNTLSSASQELVSQTAMEFVQELLRPFVSELGEVREELGAERARRQMAEERVASLEVELEAFRETRESSEPVEEEPGRAEPHSATGEAQESTASPQQRNRWLAPVDKLPWWHYVLGLLLVGLASYLSVVLAGMVLTAGMPIVVRDATLLVVGWTPPGVFGVWVGYRRTNPRFMSQIIPFGVLVGLAVALGREIDVVWLGLGSPAYVLGSIVGTVLPGWLFYVSGALIGNAWQRRRIGRISGTTPASPVSRTTQGAGQQPRKDLTPAQQAMLGWGGAIISALITLIGTIITVRSGG